jgi:hypothetical protein
MLVTSEILHKAQNSYWKLLVDMEIGSSLDGWKKNIFPVFLEMQRQN